MAESLSASKSSPRVSAQRLVLMSAPGALQKHWQSTEEAECADRKEHEAALPGEKLKETVLLVTCE